MDLEKSQEREEFSTTSVGVEFLFLVIGYHTNSQHVLYAVQVLNSIEVFSGSTGTDMQESIMNANAMSIAIFAIRSKERCMA